MGVARVVSQRILPSRILRLARSGQRTNCRYGSRFLFCHSAHFPAGDQPVRPLH